MIELEQADAINASYGSWPEKVLMALSFVMIFIGGLLACLPNS